ncbi:hypothetical protein LXL04_032419 [Taraxacum kok-saghyz]
MIVRSPDWRGRNSSFVVMLVIEFRSFVQHTCMTRVPGRLKIKERSITKKSKSATLSDTSENKIKRARFKDFKRTNLKHRNIGRVDSELRTHKIDLNRHLSHITSSFNGSLEISTWKPSKNGAVPNRTRKSSRPISNHSIRSRDQKLIMLKTHKYPPRFKLFVGDKKTPLQESDTGGGGGGVRGGVWAEVMVARRRSVVVMREKLETIFEIEFVSKKRFEIELLKELGKVQMFNGNQAPNLLFHKINDLMTEQNQVATT